MNVDKELKKKQNEEAHQLWVGIRPNPKQCPTCIHVYPDTQFTIGAEKANCEMYAPPNDKPADILWNGADCDFYEEERS